MKFNRLTIFIHWVTLILMVLAYWSSTGHPNNHPFEAPIHVAAGLWVGFLVLVRLPTRLIHSYRVRHDKHIRRDGRAEHKMMVALYVMMILVPLTGWFAMTRHFDSFSLWGMNLPLPAHDEIAKWIGEPHAFLGNVIMWLVSAHAGAALFHEYVLKVPVLGTMMPWLRKHEKETMPQAFEE